MLENIISKNAVIFFCVISSAVTVVPIAHGQNRTVGDNYGTDHKAYEFAPFKYLYWIGNEPFRDHVHEPWDGSADKGQQYDYTEYSKKYLPPDPTPGSCTLLQFYLLITDMEDDLGVLMITTHGTTDMLCIEDYDSSQAGLEARDNAYDSYIQEWGMEADEIFKGSVSGRWVIGIYNEFIREYAYMPNALVFIGSCKGSSFTDDFYNYAGVRAAVGIIGTASWADIESMAEIFFSWLDGKYGQDNRTVNAVVDAVPFWLWLYGDGSTTLTPAVDQVNAPTPLKVGDIITLQFDTECDVNYIPLVECDWCEVCNPQWLSSTSLQVEYLAPPPQWIDECEFTLRWNNLWSAWNFSRLDGNTDPWGGNNAEGPAHDDYVWTMAVDPCFCGMKGDMNNDDGTTPLDVHFLVKYVYNYLDARIYPDGWNCPYDLGDLNCDAQISPLDVQYLVRYVYKGLDSICEPCTW